MVLTMECPRMRTGSSGCSFFMRSMCCKLSLMKTWKSETTIRSPSLCPWPTAGEKESAQISHLKQWLQSRKDLAEISLLDCFCPNLTFSCSHLSTEKSAAEMQRKLHRAVKCHTVHDLTSKKPHRIIKYQRVARGLKFGLLFPHVSTCSSELRVPIYLLQPPTSG